MLNLLKVLRQDEHGVILSTEIVIIGSLLVIGLITGLTCLQKSVNGELHDLAGAIGALDQTYSFSAHRKSGVAGSCCAYTAGSSYYNCETKDQRSSDIVGCTDACEVQAVPCGNCGTCGHCASSLQTGSQCGTCGGHAALGGGCSTCGSHGLVSPKNTRCIDTGVPRMKVTEWQGSGQAIHQPYYQPYVEHPQPVPIVIPDHSGHYHSDTIIEHNAEPLRGDAPYQVPSIPVPPAPAPEFAPAPIPMPSQDLPQAPQSEVPPSA